MSTALRRLVERTVRRVRSRRSLAGRLIVLTTVAVGLSVALMALAAYVTVRHQLMTSLDGSLHRRAYQASRTEPNFDVLKALPDYLEQATDAKVGYVDAGGRVYTLSDAADAKVFGGQPEVAIARGKESYVCRTIVSNGVDYRVATVETIHPGYAIFVGQSLEPNETTLDRLGLLLFLFAAAGVLAAAAVAGWGVARNGLRPVRRLTAAAEHIARTENLDPIQVEGKDEIARLSRAFNAMLGSLAASRDRQRRLVADAGHELRTPLTSLRTNLELLTQADRQGGLSVASRQELLADVQFQIEELTTLIGDLTELARDQPAEVLLEEVDLAEITERAVERARRRASGLRFDVHADPWFVTGDAPGLERAFLNVLDNAAKWSPPGGVVTAVLEQGSLMVADQGPGIAEEDLPHVFERFYRSVDSRTMPGSGLGLAIVREVAERHGGSVRVGREPTGGAVFWVSIPGSPTPVTGARTDAEPDRQDGQNRGRRDHGAIHGEVRGHSQ
jgi:two-component system sensor histidine kinase MprB